MCLFERAREGEAEKWGGGSLEIGIVDSLVHFPDGHNVWGLVILARQDPGS